MAVVDRNFVLAEAAKYALWAVARVIVDATGAVGETKRLLEVRVPDLIDYQDAAYAKRYAYVVKRVIAAEAKAVPGETGLGEASARYLYKLMAYKDEYEVARLHTVPAFLARLDAMFPNGYSVKHNLAPPTAAKREAQGHLIAQPFGP
jgi:indolepyruvate ferredoxin oxidoreductase